MFSARRLFTSFLITSDYPVNGIGIVHFLCKGSTCEYFYQKLWFDFKTFDWKMYLALCLLALVPAIYQTIITKLVTSFANPGALDVVGQMEWFDLIDETICAFLIVPMYSVLGRAYKRENFNKTVFKLN